MKAEDIIEGLNNHIESTRNRLGLRSTGHLVLQRVVTQNTTFKAYKTYEVTLWYVDKQRKVKILSVNNTSKVIEGHDESIQRKLNIELCTLIFNWMESDNYLEILQGRYDTILEYKNE